MSGQTSKSNHICKSEQPFVNHKSGRPYGRASDHISVCEYRINKSERPLQQERAVKNPEKEQPRP